MPHTVKNLLKKSMFVQRTYRRYIQPHLRQSEPETYILRGVKFDQCVDVGAHVGLYTILLSRNSDHVYAFEPMRQLFDILLALNIQNVSIYNLALGNQNGETKIYLPTLAGKTNLALGTLRFLGAQKDEKVDTQKVKIAKFDEFEKQIDFTRIDFVKIDVEGFEMEVLRGMKRLLESKKPVLMIEIETRHNPQYPEIFDYLGSLQYESYMTVDGVGLQRLDVEELPSLQSNESLRSDAPRKFRLGERKNYINNFFFLQPNHKSLFRMA